MKKSLLIFTLSILVTLSSFAEKSKKIVTKSVKQTSAAGCAAPASQTYLELNNVRALIMTGGDMWWSISESVPKYEIPKGSGKHALFLGGIWMGGTDANDQLRSANVRYRASGVDFWTGPLITSGPERASVTPEVCLKYDKHFVISRAEVIKFRTYINAVLDGDNEILTSDDFVGYEVPEIITNWPAHGDVAAGYDYHLAPFYDVDGDDFYNPEAGDYPFYDLDNEEPCGTSRELRKPKLYGDQTLWWVYNDKGNIHTESNGEAIGMEIRAQAFAFATNDELNDMTFGNYELINRSTYTLYNTYFGVNTDADLGDESDDYVGCDVSRGLGYVYNGDDMDGTGSGKSYGAQPPAVGIDFFEGPYQDADGKDNLSNWDTLTNTLNCGKALLSEGSINGLNFEDGIVDNERWGMRRFMYYENSDPVIGDPTSAAEYYGYLKGYWLDNTRLTYGGNGNGGVVITDFAFPGAPSTDPCGWGSGGNVQPDWSEDTENNTSGDRRFVQSAGPFTLEPGAVNDITVGVVWARASSGGRLASITEVQRADDKAQKLFENCFKVVDGPDAPELTVIEMDKEFIFHLWNKKGSNNYREFPEDYEINDPFIVCPTDQPTCDKTYKFEGYQVFQLKDHTVSISDIDDINKARLVFQCDIENYDNSGNPIGKIINYNYDKDLQAIIPTLMVNGSNKGIKHAFKLTDDAFAKGDKRLVNYKTYYYVAIAYGYNNFKTYDGTQTTQLDGQKESYKPSRKSGDGQAIKIYEVVPHMQESGTIINGTYGYTPEITQVEGFGNGYNELDLTDASLKEIIDNGYSSELTYKENYGPIKVSVIDPLNVKNNNYVLKFDSVTVVNDPGFEMSPLINNAKWYVYTTGDNPDTVYSESWITYNNQQIIPEWGLSIEIKQIPYPGFSKENKNGFISASIEWENESNVWLDFIHDQESVSQFNWIRSGELKDVSNPGYDDYGHMTLHEIDPGQEYEKILDGTWAPYIVARGDYSSSSKQSSLYGVAYRVWHNRIKPSHFRIGSVNLVITNDKSKWSRCPVIELSEYDNSNGGYDVGLSEGGAEKFNLRKHASVDKSGKVYATVGSGSSQNEKDANYISDTGMGWFPGYAIDIETGERLNVAFGEDSKLIEQNGRDMIWNPTDFIFSSLYLLTGGMQGELYNGGKHVIYIWGNNEFYADDDYKKYNCPRYDNGKWLRESMEAYETDDFGKQTAWRNVMWVSIPILNTKYADYDKTKDPYGFIKSDVKFKFRMANPYSVDKGMRENTNPKNNNWPMYKFSTEAISTVNNDNDAAKEALDKINVVPNPYYGYSEYELTQLDNYIKFINLPQECVISIYSVNGTLIKRFNKNNPLTWQDWNLKNEYGITIAGGVYIVHINVPGVGEKVLKWFGALRPIDLNNF